MTTHRSPIFALSDSYVEKSARLSPMASTYLGISDLNDQLDDFSIAGRAIEAELTRATLAELSKLEPIDEIDLPQAFSSMIPLNHISHLTFLHHLLPIFAKSLR